MSFHRKAEDSQTFSLFVRTVDSLSSLLLEAAELEVLFRFCYLEPDTNFLFFSVLSYITLSRAAD